MTIEALAAVRERVESGSFGLGPETARAVVARIDDFLQALDAADQALARLPKPAVADAAAKLALARYLSGRGWRRYVADNAEVAAAAAEIRTALDGAMQELAGPLARFLSARAPDRVRTAGAGSFALPCAACDADAVTLMLERVSPKAQEQLVVSSLSPVTVFRSLAGPRMTDLLAVLQGGDVDAVVRHLRDTQPGGCDAYCEPCARLYCKAHYAIEAQWSGSWHEATYATCALGHEHTID